jgi:hypothetical protein
LLQSFRENVSFPEIFLDKKNVSRKQTLSRELVKIACHPNIFPKLLPFFHMLLTSFAFFVMNLRKSQQLFIFALIDSKIFALVFGKQFSRKFEHDFRGNFVENERTNIFGSNLVDSAGKLELGHFFEITYETSG